MTSYRLEYGKNNDTVKVINFTFDGKSYQGLKGDTLASALMANGVKIVGRSFKYHRPRGLISAGVEEANGIVQLGLPPFEEPNVKMTTVAIYEGLHAKSVNCWPNAKFDILSALGIAKPFFVSGFYYKVFKWPSWKFWSPLVRRMAGLGTLPKAHDPDVYDTKYIHTDILIVGAGPSGLKSALEYSKEGLKVLIVEQDRKLGGSLLFEQERIGGVSSLEWVTQCKDKLQGLNNVRIFTRATAVGYYDDNLVTVSQRLTDHQGLDKNEHLPREYFWHIRAGKVVLATGAIERPLVFSNNDRPGVMLASAVRHYINRYNVSPGKQLVVATNNDDAYRTAIAAHNVGIKVNAVIDARNETASNLIDQVCELGIKILFSSVIVDVVGKSSVKEVQVLDISDRNEAKRNILTVKCDFLAISSGWSPVVHLHSQAGGKLTFSENIQSFIPSSSSQQNESVGAANGEFDLWNILTEVKPLKTSPIIPLWDVPDFLQKYCSSKRWVDFQHDVTAGDIAIAARENYTSVEHFKRYTTTGMAMDQGKTSNINALAILGHETDRAIPDVGTTKFRPPYTPVTLGALAGRNIGKLYSPIRYLACHDWHVEQDAIMDEFGSWIRPTCYPIKGEFLQETINREVHHVRNHVGILDYSPLGKIDVQGADAASFLDKFYINNVKSLKVGQARYGLMLNEQGSVMEDGVFSRLDKDQYWLTTTSGNAIMVANWLDEWRQCEWPDLDVVVTPMTTGWGTISIQGPKSRLLLEALDLGIDLSNDVFPHMSVRLGQISGVKIRVLRTSFTGELGYELNIPTSYMKSLWEMVMVVGESLQVAPFGLEALLTMRLEKGYIHVGGDTDSSTIPADIGFGKVTSNKKVDFIGKRSLSREVALRGDREALVGFEAQGLTPLPVGGIVMADGYKVPPAPMEGRVTSSCFSPTLNKPIAIGLLKNGTNRYGETVKIYDVEGIRKAKVVDPCFYDKEGKNVHG